MNGNRKKRKLFKMWLEDPKCHWCGEDTVLIMRTLSHNRGENKVRPLGDEATIDHLYSRYSPDRKKPNIGNEKRVVLSCWDCNHERGRIETSEQPIEELHKRAGQGTIE